MTFQAEEIELSNVDSTGEQTSSKSAWGDKSNSPKTKEIDTTEEDPGFLFLHDPKKCGSNYPQFD